MMSEDQNYTGPPLCGLTEEQVSALQAPLDAQHIEERQGFSYLKGHHVIREMNRIFGPTGWSRETVSMKRVVEAPYQKDGRTGTEVAFVAQVRVVAGGVVKEGTGFGNGITYQQTAADAYESATKEAETDALKRACMMFGDPLGLAIYDPAKTHVAGGGSSGGQSNGGSPAPQQSSGGQPQAAPSGGEFGPCPKCGEELRKRTGGKGDFVGCSSYKGKDNPGCGFTSDVEAAPPPVGAAPPPAAPPSAPSPSGYPSGQDGRPEADPNHTTPPPDDDGDPFGDDTFDEEGYPVSVAGVSEFLSALGVPEGDARPDLIDNAMKALWGARVKPETLTADHCVALGRKLEELMPSGG